MQNAARIMKFVAAALIVIVLGGLVGWYYVVQSRIASTSATDTARGMGATPSFGGPAGSTFENTGSGFLTGTGDAAPGEVRAAPRFWRISQTPVAGFGFASSSPRLYFADTATGNILEADPLTGATVRLTNTLFPKAFDAHFSESGAVVMRFMEGELIRTYAGRIATSTSSTTTSAPTQLIGTYLSPGITEIAVGAQESLVYIVEDASGASIVQSDWRGGAQKKLFTAPLKAWRVQSLGDGMVVLTQKASDGITGHAFTLSASGALAPLVENAAGLTTLAKDRSTLLYGTADTRLSLFVRTGGTDTSLPLQSTAEKCVWAHGTSLIAYCAVPRITGGARTLLERYQGVRHTSDTWYRVNIAAGTAEEIFAGDGSAAIDVEKPVIDVGNRYIAFTNAADKSLWMLRIAP